MPILYQTGDLLAAPERVIVHGCNAQGVMGKGVAKLIRDRYPAAYAAYRAAHEQHGLKLGQTIWVPCDPHTVVNAITQADYRRAASETTLHADYDAIRAAFHEINATARMTQKVASAAAAHGGAIERIALPLIGAGLAGGSWRVIAPIIEEECQDVQPVVYLLDGIVPTT